MGIWLQGSQAIQTRCTKFFQGPDEGFRPAWHKREGIQRTSNIQRASGGEEQVQESLQRKQPERREEGRLAIRPVRNNRLSDITYPQRVVRTAGRNYQEALEGTQKITLRIFGSNVASLKSKKSQESLWRIMERGKVDIAILVETRLENGIDIPPELTAIYTKPSRKGGVMIITTLWWIKEIFVLQQKKNQLWIKLNGENCSIIVGGIYVRCVGTTKLQRRVKIRKVGKEMRELGIKSVAPVVVFADWNIEVTEAIQILKEEDEDVVGYHMEEWSWKQTRKGKPVVSNLDGFAVNGGYLLGVKGIEHGSDHLGIYGKMPVVTAARKFKKLWSKKRVLDRWKSSLPPKEWPELPLALVMGNNEQKLSGLGLYKDKRRILRYVMSEDERRRFRNKEIMISFRKANLHNLAEMCDEIKELKKRPKERPLQLFRVDNKLFPIDKPPPEYIQILKSTYKDTDEDDGSEVNIRGYIESAKINAALSKALSRMKRIKAAMGNGAFPIELTTLRRRAREDEVDWEIAVQAYNPRLDNAIEREIQQLIPENADYAENAKEAEEQGELRREEDGEERREGNGEEAKEERKQPTDEQIANAWRDRLLNFVKGIMTGKNRIPHYFKEYRSVLLSKTGTDIAPVDKIRTLLLINQERKLLEYAILFIVQKDLWNDISSKQHGFRPHDNTHVAIFEVIKWIQQNKDDNEMGALIYVDLEKAFESVDHGILFKNLKEEYPEYDEYWKMYEDILRNSSVRFGKERVFTRRGLPMGSPLSPLMFAYYTKSVTEKINFREILGEQYADDILLAIKNVWTTSLSLKRHLNLDRVPNGLGIAKYFMTWLLGCISPLGLGLNNYKIQVVPLKYIKKRKNKRILENGEEVKRGWPNEYSIEGKKVLFNGEAYDEDLLEILDFGNELEWKVQTKARYLGVDIDPTNMKKAMMEQIQSYVNNCKGIARELPGVSARVRFILAEWYVRSRVEYVATVGVATGILKVEEIEAIYYRALREIFKVPKYYGKDVLKFALGVDIAARILDRSVSIQWLAQQRIEDWLLNLARKWLIPVEAIGEGPTFLIDGYFTQYTWMSALLKNGWKEIKRNNKSYVNDIRPRKGRQVPWKIIVREKVDENLKEILLEEEKIDEKVENCNRVKNRGLLLKGQHENGNGNNEEKIGEDRTLKKNYNLSAQTASSSRVPLSYESSGTAVPSPDQVLLEFKRNIISVTGVCNLVRRTLTQNPCYWHEHEIFSPDHWFECEAVWLTYRRIRLEEFRKRVTEEGKAEDIEAEAVNRMERTEGIIKGLRSSRERTLFAWPFISQREWIKVDGRLKPSVEATTWLRELQWMAMASDIAHSKNVEELRLEDAKNLMEDNEDYLEIRLTTPRNDLKKSDRGAAGEAAGYIEDSEDEPSQEELEQVGDDVLIRRRRHHLEMEEAEALERKDHSDPEVGPGEEEGCHIIQPLLLFK
eukprot:TRINITY_DN89198_c0_g1_i1.p1 TRINITY_DN89198_c0_g1~~TRINITY_DN89198_c0_g1_i1.p1  ORF type:complete len:1447 (+),score=185.16 TRINITY_DN89198_c0_g1_i1:3193-7533(+)